MVEEIDLWRTAKIVVDQQDDQAPLYAAQRADALLEAGDLEGAALWRRIKGAIEELQIVTPPDSLGS